MFKNDIKWKIWPILSHLTLFGPFLEHKFIVSFILSYRYLFKGHFPFCPYRASIWTFWLTVQNDTDHLSTSAGVCRELNKLKTRLKFFLFGRPVSVIPPCLDLKHQIEEEMIIPQTCVIFLDRLETFLLKYDFYKSKRCHCSSRD